VKRRQRGPVFQPKRDAERRDDTPIGDSDLESRSAQWTGRQRPTRDKFPAQTKRLNRRPALTVRAPENRTRRLTPSEQLLIP
jgi:hypothetical protein